MKPYLSNHKTFYKTERGFCYLVCYEQKPPTVFKNTFPFVQNPSLKLVAQKLHKCSVLSAKNAVWSLSACLEAFPEGFCAKSGTVGKLMMSATQRSHQALKTLSLNHLKIQSSKTTPEVQRLSCSNYIFGISPKS